MNADTKEVIQKAHARRIAEIKVVDREELVVRFQDGTRLGIYDDAQCCCEYRFMTCDDDLGYHIGALFLTAEVRDVVYDDGDDDRYGVHDIQFLTLTTTKGVIVIANHNEHNGYYGGFRIRADFLALP